jgi:hypothetical protein
VSLDGADHLLTHAKDANYVATVLAGWASRYLSAPATAPSDDTDQPSDEGTVTVTDSGPGALDQTIRPGGIASSPTNHSASATTSARRPMTCGSPRSAAAHR